MKFFKFFRVKISDSNMQQRCCFQPIYKQTRMKIILIQTNKIAYITFSQSNITFEINLTFLSSKDSKRESKI